MSKIQLISDTTPSCISGIHLFINGMNDIQFSNCLLDDKLFQSLIECYKVLFGLQGCSSYIKYNYIGEYKFKHS